MDAQERVHISPHTITGRRKLDYLRERADLSLVDYSPLLKGRYDAPAAERPGHYGMGPYMGDASARRLAVVD